MKSSRERDYSNLLKSGGYTKEQLADFKKDISNQRENLDKYGRNYARERRDRLSNIKTNIDRANSIMKDSKN